MPVILSVNAGSSSLKISVYHFDPSGAAAAAAAAAGGAGGGGGPADPATAPPRELAVAQVNGLTAPPPVFTYELAGDSGKRIKETLDGIEGHEGAFAKIIDSLVADEHVPELKEKGDVRFVCHRVVHGGDYPSAHRIDEEMYHHIAELSDLAPLHNAAALRLIRTISEQLPTSIPLAFFDTSFHSTLPPHVRTYPISPARAQKNKLRKYGFHGLSYASILRHTSASLGKAKERVSIIALHLGSGASACAIRDGASLDTSMGITPLAGLPGATRSGSVDPSLVFHYTHNAGKPSRAASKELHVTRAEEILNKECGWKALAGTTDFGVVSEGRSEEARLAFDIFVDRVVGFVGSYFVKLGGRVDALVFAGGIGEKGAKLRREVVRAVECLGYGVDEGKNEAVGKGDEEGVVVEIGKEGCRRVLVVKTDEQSEMALGCMEVAGKIEAAK